MNELTLARLEHENMLEWLRVEIGGVPGAQVDATGGVSIFLSGLPVPLFNQIVLNHGATPGDLRGAIGTARGRAAPYSVVFQRGAHDWVGRLADELGLVADEEIVPGMVVHPLPARLAPPSPGFELRLVSDQVAMDGHIRVAAAGFDMPAAPVRAFIGEDLWRRPGAAVYVGLADGEPVTSGLGIRTGRTIGAYTIATVESARGRGFAEAMTRRILADGADAGCDVGTLQASSMGKRIYERIGFRTFLEYASYVEPAASASPQTARGIDRAVRRPRARPGAR